MEPFQLWQPEIQQADNAHEVAFDVSSTGIKELTSGTPELLEGFLSTLEIPVTSLADWTVEEFRTPYYSSYQDSDEWEDRYRQCWRITAQVELDGRYTPAPVLTPVAAEGTDTGYDPLTAEDPSPVTRCVVIASEVSKQPAPIARDRIDAGTGGVTWTSVPLGENGHFHQVRIDLGRMDVSESFGAVDHVVAQCVAARLCTSWRSAFTRAVELDLLR